MPVAAIQYPLREEVPSRVVTIEVQYAYQEQKPHFEEDKMPLDSRPAPMNAAGGNYETPNWPLTNAAGAWSPAATVVAMPLDWLFIPINAAGAAPQLVMLMEVVKS